LSDEKPTWESPMIIKKHCAWCLEQIKPIDPAIEFTMTVWINGYWTQQDESKFYCQKCSKDGFTLLPKVSGQ